MAASAEDYDDDYDEYYDEEDVEGVSGFVVLVVAVVVLIVFSGVVWFAYQRGVQNSPPPVIAANPEPMRTEQPIELEQPSASAQEASATLEGNVPTEVVVDTTTERDPLEGFQQTTSAAAESLETATQAAEQTAQDIASLTQSVTTEQPATTTDDEPVRDPEPQPVTREPVVETPQPEPVRQPVATLALSGSHLVQVGAFRSDAEALGYFDRLEQKFGALVAEKAPDVQRADLGSRGIYFRLRVGPFSSKEQAAAYCSQLKQQGQDCLVKPV